MLSPMRFKSFTWPHNPRTFEIEYRRAALGHKLPLSGSYIQDMGRDYRVFKGEGEFAGAQAYAQFKRLASLFMEGGSGYLWHPMWTAVKAHFIKLSLKQEPREDYVNYSFEFWESFDKLLPGVKPAASGASGLRPDHEGIREAIREYTVNSEDTLGAIAARNMLPITDVLKLNPLIKNPNLIKLGDRIRLV